MENEWRVLVDEIMNCKKCELHKYRKNAVPGEGSLNSHIIFVGEAPGAQEDEVGRPFVGAAGKLLTELIHGIGLKREEIYITNIVKCRPPGNRDPEDLEIEACSPYLLRQIMLIKPKVIIALGRHSAKYLFTKAGLSWRNMSTMHGKVYDAMILGLRVKLIATYHPAAALYNPNLRSILQDDFVIIGREIRKTLHEDTGRKTLLDYF